MKRRVCHVHLSKEYFRFVEAYVEAYTNNAIPCKETSLIRQVGVRVNNFTILSKNTETKS